MTIVEFLLARIAEDERCQYCRHPITRHVGRWCRVPTGAITADGRGLICCCAGADSLDRALAECAAKRAIVERNAPYDDIQVRRQTRTLAGDTLRQLAAIYADHPDYRQEWKP